jgi:hypothetical protein
MFGGGGNCHFAGFNGSNKFFVAALSNFSSLLHRSTGNVHKFSCFRLRSCANLRICSLTML